MSNLSSIGIKWGAHPGDPRQSYYKEPYGTAGENPYGQITCAVAHHQHIYIFAAVMMCTVIDVIRQLVPYTISR